MRVLFIPFRETWETPEQKELLKNSASSRMRCDWIAKYWDEARVWKNEGNDYLDDTSDVYIFQKAMTPKMCLFAGFLKSRGKKIILDLCDAEWAKPNIKKLLEEMVGYADHLTASSFYIYEHLAKTYRKPTSLIVDRLDLKLFPEVKEHRVKNKPKVVWFGNRNTIKYVNLFSEVLFEVYHAVPFTLVLISDLFDGYKHEAEVPWEVEKIPWSLDNFNKDVLGCDVAINPHEDDEIGLSKSLNKTIVAWALGLPVVSHGNHHRLVSLLTNYLQKASLRQQVGQEARKKVEQLFDVRDSAWEFACVAKEVFYGKR